MGMGFYRGFEGWEVRWLKKFSKVCVWECKCDGESKIEKFGIRKSRGEGKVEFRGRCGCS